MRTCKLGHFSNSFNGYIISALLMVSVWFLIQGAIAQAGEYSYQNDTTLFPNPDRGWYAYAPILGNSSYAEIGNSGVRLIYGAITLSEFVHTDIREDILIRISQRFAEIRKNGIKAVLRVNYNEEETGTDAQMDQMIAHMKQLQPLLDDNRDVIAYIEIGYFGQWGEWHDWCGGKANTDLTDDFCSKHLDEEATWTKLIAELLPRVPDNRFLMIRYPAKKQVVFDGKAVTDKESYSSLGKARIGHHNDCFLASDDDRGTYQTLDLPISQSELKAYVQRDTEYLPMGGETCYAEKGHRFYCADALKEMAQMHWTYLNRDYYQGALKLWKDGGCLEEIDRRLGYRLELRSAKLPDTLIAGATQVAEFRIHNSGFARAHYKRKAYLRLFQDNDVIADIELSGVDLRSIGSGETLTVKGSFTIPVDVEEQRLSVALWLPDEDPENRKNSRFSIRLAYQQNSDDWARMSSPGHNLLARDVPVVADEPLTKPHSPINLRVVNY